MRAEKNGIILGREIEFFNHNTEPEWGYSTNQRDSFAVIHPKNEEAGKNYPLIVVFHSAGHDLYSTINTLFEEGNHDIYHTPDDTFGLYLDCRANFSDFWWGGRNRLKLGADQNREGTELQPVEKRCLDTVKWTTENYNIDENRVYAVGNSMGGSGALGIAYARGDIFAAIKANVPAGVEHVLDRIGLNDDSKEKADIPDPPVTVDYSAQNDDWSYNHDKFYKVVRENNYPIIGFWGMFGHGNNNSEINKYNDLIHSLDVYAIKKNEAYPVFTNATTDNKLPWPERSSEEAGQVNGFFRWRVIRDSKEHFAIELRLLNESEWTTTIFNLPEESRADVMLRRIHNFAVDDKISAKFDGKTVNVEIKNGRPFVSGLVITKNPKILEFSK